MHAQSDSALLHTCNNMKTKDSSAGNRGYTYTQAVLTALHQSMHLASSVHV